MRKDKKNKNEKMLQILHYHNLKGRRDICNVLSLAKPFKWYAFMWIKQKSFNSSSFKIYWKTLGADESKKSVL